MIKKKFNNLSGKLVIVIRLSIVSLIISSASTSITNALTITNYNTKSIRVEVMDCASKALYSFPTDWKSDTYKSDPIRHIDFLHINRVLPNGQVVIDKEANTDMPSTVCLHVEGWSSWFGGVITKVRSSCDINIYDNGFLQGIRAEYGPSC